MERVVNYIRNHATKDLPVTNREISSVLNIAESQVRTKINKARSNGIPICSCDKGYWYSEDKADILQTIESLMHRTISVEKAVSGLISTLKYEERGWKPWPITKLF